MTAVHEISAAEFASLAATGGTPAGAAALRASQFSKNVLLLRGIMETARENHPEAYVASRFEDGYDVLAAAQELDPETVNAVLVHPHCGNWVTHCLRVLHDSAAGDPAVEALLGQMNALAVSAAATVGHPFDMTLPLDHGKVLLPALGVAMFDASPDAQRVHATYDGKNVSLTVGDQTVEVPGDHRQDGPGWFGLRRITTEVDGLILDVDLDDIGLFRYSTAVGRLDAEGFEYWERLTHEAWAFLVGLDRDRAEVVGEVATTLIPLRGGTIANGTSPDSFGAIYTEARADGPELAEILVHECQHSKLNALFLLTPFYEPGMEVLYYSPARDDPRPVGGLLHGCYAFAAVLDFWRRYRHVLDGGRQDYAHLQVALWLKQLRRAVRTLSDSGRLTPVGAEFVAGLSRQLDQWNTESVPAEERARGESIAEDHYLMWRLNNLQYAPSEVSDLVGAWLDGRPATAVAVLSAPESLTGVVGRMVTRRERLGHLRTLDPERTTPEQAVTTDGDSAYYDGDYEEAARRYLRQIETQPDGVDHWAGLALATQALTDADDRAALVQRPELVYAVHLALRSAGESPPDPWTLARWLAPHSQPGIDAFVAREAA